MATILGPSVYTLGLRVHRAVVSSMIPPLLLSSEGSGPSIFTKYYWIRQAVPSLPGPVYKRVEIPIPPLLGKQNKTENMKAQIAEFFEFWATDGIDGPRCKDFIFSICDGKELARAVPHTQPFRSKKGFMTHVTESSKQYFTGDILGDRNVQSPMWKYQALVIVDPFLSQHNVTHTITTSLVNKLRKQAKVTSQLLKKGHSPLEIFGPSITDRRISRTHTTSADGIDGFFPVSTLDQTVHERRNWTIFLVNEAVRKRYGHNYHVECFGSTRYGVDSATSDLDLVIVDANRPLGFCYEAKLPIIYNVRDLGKTLHQNGFKVEEVIPQAAVPIVKFYDPRNRMQCDINVNDQLGLFNTQLIAHYCELFHPLPTLLLAIKKWAKSLGLNNPSGRGGSTSFSSYALTVMTIGYLQPLGILPNLQAGLSPLPPPPRNPEFDAEGVYWQRERTGPPKRCDRRFNRLQYWQPPGDKKYDIHSLLLGWFRYWGEQHEYPTQLMSIRDGGILTRVIESPKKKEKKEKKSKKGKAEGKDKEGTRDADAAQAKDTPSPRPESPSGALEKVSLTEEPEEKSILSEGEENVRDADGEGTAEDLAAVDLANGKQPKWWKNATLVVADPFILTKNVTGSVSQRVIDRFKADCRRAVFIMEHGGAFEDLLGTGETLSANPRFNQSGYFTKSREKRQKALETKKVPTANTTIPWVKTEAAAKQENNAVA
ncbi:hypothetical protein SCHPADRAFT_126698 [Schizopora paradoxa]|uniref:Poly(A) RNA polymerase mitochondrial-like central palm domain-containing protein n=1 Tax=Schizopora paradoxa TaxID=27342 RepID=A0A0H2S1N4_9AGAM|nr:hypothetical protein SCHPADRAFT_126698 [Schizopora paradoxa]